MCSLNARFALLLPMIGCVALAACDESNADSKGGAGGGAGGPPPTRVEVAVARSGTLDSGSSFLGHVEAAMATDVAAAVEGRVRAVQVREGSAVAKGDLLVQLDSRRIATQARAAEAVVARTSAQLEQARKQLGRIEKSSAALSAPEKERFGLEVATLEAQLAADEAALARERVELSDHRITAPFDGVVQDRRVDPGAWVSVGEATVRLVATADVEVLVDVPFASGRQIKEGTSAKLRTSFGTVEASVAGVVAALDAQSRMMRLRLVPSEGASWLVPGLPVDVELPVKVSGDGVLVPRDAVVSGPAGYRIVVVRDGVGEPMTVEVIGTSDDRALVSAEGLEAGDQVITRGNERYRPGTPLEIIK